MKDIPHPYSKPDFGSFIWIVIFTSLIMVFVFSLFLNLYLLLENNGLIDDYNSILGRYDTLSKIPRTVGCFFPANQTIVIQVRGRSYSDALETFNHEWEHYKFSREHFERCDLYRETNNSMG